MAQDGLQKHEKRDAFRLIELDGSNPRKRGREKDLAALLWVYRWGWSSSSIINAIASPSRAVVAARLVRGGALETLFVEHAGGIADVPANVLVLTPDGVELAESQLNEDGFIGYPRDPRRLIVWRQLRHDLIVQRATARQLNAGRINAFITPRELAAQSQFAIKQPDVVWIKNDLKIAVELELTAKVGREFHQTIYALLQSVFPGDPKTKTKGGPWDVVLIASNSKAILGRYRAALTPGAQLQRYERDSQKRWYASRIMQIPDWAGTKFQFYEIEK